MATIYLENHTVDITPELWEFAQGFQFEASMIPLLLDPVYSVIEFRNIPSKFIYKVIVKMHRADRTHVRASVDAWFVKSARNGRTAGWRTFVKMDTEKELSKASYTDGLYFDLKGNVMQQGHIDGSNEEFADDLANCTQYCINIFTFVQQVLKFNPGDLEEVEVALPEKEVKHGTSKKKRKQSSGVVATTRTYKTYRLKKNYDFTERNPVIRQCRLWYVRGHDRHLSDGRTVHIDPYYKGVDREYAKPEDGDFGRKIMVKPIA